MQRTVHPAAIQAGWRLLPCAPDPHPGSQDVSVSSRIADCLPIDQMRPRSGDGQPPDDGRGYALIHQDSHEILHRGLRIWAYGGSHVGGSR